MANKENKHTMTDLYQMQSLPLSAKIRMTQNRINWWVDEFGEDGVYVSFSGGKDSTVLVDIVRNVCGYKNIPDSTWWTRVLKPVLDKYHLCYFHTWRNYNKEYFAPAPGHPSAMDFLKLYNDRRTLFLRDIQRIK